MMRLCRVYFWPFGRFSLFVRFQVDSGRTFGSTIDSRRNKLCAPDNGMFLGYDRATASCAVGSNIGTVCRGTFRSYGLLRGICVPSNMGTVNSDTFFNYGSLGRLVLPSSIRVVNSYTFSTYRSLHGVAVPGSMEIVPNKAFSSYSSLRRVGLPSKASDVR